MNWLTVEKRETRTNKKEKQREREKEKNENTKTKQKFDDLGLNKSVLFLELSIEKSSKIITF